MLKDKIASCRVERRRFSASFDFAKASCKKKPHIMGMAAFFKHTNEKAYRPTGKEPGDNFGVTPARKQPRR